MVIFQIASCRYCIKQIGSEKAVHLSCGHLFHLSCALEFLQHGYKCFFCSSEVSKEYQIIKMRKPKRCSPPLSLLSSIPEESEWKFSKFHLSDFEEICESKLCHSFPANLIHRKPPKSIIKRCHKLFCSCRNQLSKKPELSLQNSLQILWLIKNVRKNSDEIVKASGQCERVARFILEQARNSYVKIHFS